MANRLKRTWMGAAALAAFALGGAAVAAGAGSGSKASTTTTSTTPASTPTRTPETALTGDTATKAKAAAVAKVGGTADSATTENDSSNATAAYEVHVTKADGSHVTAILDKSFAVLDVETQPTGPDHGHGG